VTGEALVTLDPTPSGGEEYPATTPSSEDSEPTQPHARTDGYGAALSFSVRRDDPRLEPPMRQFIAALVLRVHAEAMRRGEGTDGAVLIFLPGLRGQGMCDGILAAGPSSQPATRGHLTLIARAPASPLPPLPPPPSGIGEIRDVHEALHVAGRASAEPAPLWIVPLHSTLAESVLMPPSSLTHSAALRSPLLLPPRALPTAVMAARGWGCGSLPAVLLLPFAERVHRVRSPHPVGGRRASRRETSSAAFERRPGYRKVVLATNIAERSGMPPK